jgi:hypothetical protein
MRALMKTNTVYLLITMSCYASYGHAKKTSLSVKLPKVPVSKSTGNRSQPKAPYAGFGKTSQANGRMKTTRVQGYVKPSNGYKFVNPYARSKR